MKFPIKLPKGSICVKKKKWEVEGDLYEIITLMLLSLGAQVILTFFGNRRKYQLSSLSRFFVWLSYLMASPVVTFVLGKLSAMSTTTYVGKENDQDSNWKYSDYKFYMDGWATMLLVQICSPNMISYSVEDNKLTSRQVIGLSTQVALAVWILFQAFIFFYSISSYILDFGSILTILWYVVGLIKVVERLRAFMSLRNREKVVITTFTHNGSRKVGIPIEFSSNSGTTSDDLALLVKAYQRFDRLKPYLENWLGHHSSSYLSNSVSVDYRHPKDVFRVTEFELSFMYDVLYTNSSINYSKRSFLGRIICLLILFLWCVYLGLNMDIEIDFITTFVLLIGALLLESYEMKELLCSDWTVLHMMNQNRSARMRRFLRIVARKLLSKKHRWSHSMDQFNLLSYCLYGDSTKLGGLIWRIPKVKGYYNEYKKYCIKKDIQVPEELKKLILQQMEEVRAQRGGNPFSECGEWPLEKCYCLQDLEFNIPQDFGSHAKKQTKIGKAIIIWHIATSVCYYLDDGHLQDVINPSERELSNFLSNYMMYLLAMHPDMLSIVPGDILFRGVCAQVGEVLKTKESRDEATLCKILVDELVDENYLQGIPKKNVLTSEWNLVLQVQKLAGILRGREDKWEFINSVWVEMLCYGATNCPWTLHAEQLRRGGELLTHVWLLLEHEKDEANVQSPQMQYDA